MCRTDMILDLNSFELKRFEYSEICCSFSEIFYVAVLAVRSGLLSFSIHFPTGIPLEFDIMENRIDLRKGDTT